MRIYSLIGPTAVGKSAVALQLAKVAIERGLYSGVDLISVDSRQVYQGLEIVTGADVPDGFVRKQAARFHFPYYELGAIRVHGVSILRPDQEWSVSHFQEFALPIISRSSQQRRLSLLIGGTGLYHQLVFESAAQLHLGPNKDVRAKAAAMSIEELQQWVQRVAPHRWEQMNHADRHNSRRLVRSIEIAIESKVDEKTKLAVQSFTAEIDHLYVGLTDSLVAIASRIKHRVTERLRQGAIAEVQEIVATYHDWSLPALSATGVSEIHQLLTGAIDEAKCIESWTLREVQYAKRQLTWWQRHQVQWFLLTQPNYQQAVIAHILGK